MEDSCTIPQYNNRVRERVWWLRFTEQHQVNSRSLDDSHHRNEGINNFTYYSFKTYDEKLESIVPQLEISLLAELFYMEV